MTQKQPLLSNLSLCIDFFLFLFFPLESYVLKAVNICGRGPAGENAIAAWKTRCVRGTGKEEGTALSVRVSRLLLAWPIHE